MSAAGGDGQSFITGEAESWRRPARKAKSFVAQQLRQVPCLHAILPALSCCKSRSSKYQTLGQDEDDDSAALQDDRQRVNRRFGLVMIRVAMFCAVAITIKLMVQNRGLSPDDYYGGGTNSSAVSTEDDVTDLDAMKEYAKDAFHRDSPIVLFMAVVEILACGACATTAAAMYRRRRHQLQHPADSNEKIKAFYVQVHLAKELGQEDKQSYGLGFRPSSDGLECLIVESVRWGSILDKWNRGRHDPSPEEMMEEALGDEEMVEVENNDSASADAPSDATAAPGSEGPPPVRDMASEIRRALRRRMVEPGNAIVAINDVAGDVGMMQLQLLKPKVTLWVRQEFHHASQFQDGLFSREVEAARQQGNPEGGDSSAPTVVGAPGSGGEPQPQGAGPQAAPVTLPAVRPVRIGAGDTVIMDWNTLAGLALGFTDPSRCRGPRCACVGLEDEEPQILNRWLACSMIFGWVTMLPVLLMQPHEERPRQQLFRQFLLKPCILILPIWLIFWLLDCIQVALELPIVTPLAFFGITHMIMPAVLCWYLLQMQAADEELVLEQRAAREREVMPGSAPPVAVEDPAPTFLKELIMINPVALCWLGACVAIPLVACSLLTPMKTERGKLAQGTVTLIYTPLMSLQLAFGFVLWHLKFEEVPKLYLTGFGLLLSLPCFVVWCFCMVCSSRYGRKDLDLVRQQRLDRGKALKAKLEGSNSEQAQDLAGTEARTPEVHDPAQLRSAASLPSEIVDCSEAQCREWELIYTA